QAPASLASAAIQRGARWVDDPAALQAAIGTGSSATRLFRHSASSAYAWEFVASQSANGSTQYTYAAPTTRDSLPNANPRTSFMVEARWTGGDAFWDSAPDSGYSVDNLAPGPPAQLAARWYSGTSVLSWTPNLETDLYGYRVYRGTTSTFIPGPGTLVASPPDTGYVDAAGAAYWYKVSAVDIHGNESAFATVLPQGVSGSPPGEAAPRLALAVASQNPTPSETVLRIDLTRSGPVRLAVYDAAGRLEREIASGSFPAGEWFRKWDGRDQEGRPAPTGVYFVRLDAESHSIVQKVALLH
ncbi:MAG TPA: FlgD immunoglobulin-like domain containing protein, partial [Candidatus Omnitrophota bacterium]|nr:FlgD immunoglobulin-like domain containing protein [Candidatus Omnitrophota bacterium]